MHKFFRALTILVLACLYLVGCGNATPTNSMTLKVVQNSNATGYFPLYVAEQQGFFKAQDLTLQPAIPPQLGTGPKVTAALESNSIDLAAGVITDAFTASRVDATIRLLGTLSVDLGVDVIVSKKFLQQTHLTEASPLADKVKALVGKKIGVTSIGSATNAYVTYLFRQQKMNAATDATVVGIGASNTVAGLAALKNGRVDALAFPVPAGQEAEQQGIGTMLIRDDVGRDDDPSLQGAITSVLYARSDVIQAKPKAVQAFIRAIAQAETWIHKNPANALVLLAHYMKLDQKIVKNLIAPVTMPGIPSTPLMTSDSYNAAMSFHVNGGLLAVPLTYSDLVDTNTINSALKGLPA